MLYINSFCIMYSVCICSWWWDVHTCIYFISSVVFADFLIKSSFKKMTAHSLLSNNIKFIKIKSAIMPDLDCTLNSAFPYVVHGKRFVGGSPAKPEVVHMGSLKAGRKGPSAFSTPLASNGVKMVRKSARVCLYIVLSASARSSAVINDDKS